MYCNADTYSNFEGVVKTTIPLISGRLYNFDGTPD